jgi:hypothetical protein
MILQRILDYLAEHRLASGEQIARALGADPGAVEAMLETLERHRRVQRAVGQACGSCQQRCGNVSTVFFALAEDGRPQPVGACAVVPFGSATDGSGRD